MATDPTKQVQDQMMEAIKKSQEAVIQAVSSWSDTVGRMLPNLPDLPKMPLADSLPTPGELSGQFFDFAQRVLTSQREFVEKLVAALPGPDKGGAETPPSGYTV